MDRTVDPCQLSPSLQPWVLVQQGHRKVHTSQTRLPGLHEMSQVGFLLPMFSWNPDRHWTLQYRKDSVFDFLQLCMQRAS